jgi:hypothetical protein
VSGTTAAPEIEEHEVGFYQSVDTLIELDGGINPRKATRSDFRKKWMPGSSFSVAITHGLTRAIQGKWACRNIDVRHP